MYAIQGAMAVRRERSKRRARRMSHMRRGSQSGSLYSVVLDEEEQEEERLPPKTSSSLTAFHIGVVFILLGFIMIFSSLIGTNNMMNDYQYDDEERAQHRSDWSKLLGVGVTFIIVGLLMVMVNRIITSREEEELEQYVKRRLARTRSGHALVRDAEQAPTSRRFSAYPQSLQQQQQQLMMRRGSTATHGKSPRVPGKVVKPEGKSSNGSIKIGEGHVRGGSFYGTQPQQQLRPSRRQSIKEPKRRSLSHQQLPSNNLEIDEFASSVSSKRRELKAPINSVSAEEIETDILLPPSSSQALPSPSVSYCNELNENWNTREAESEDENRIDLASGRDKFKSSRRKKRQE